MARSTKVRKGMPSVQLTKAEFAERFRSRFYDPAFDAVAGEIEKIIEKAWDGYHQYRKSPRTREAGRGFADPDFKLPIDWLETRNAVQAAEKRQKASTIALTHSLDQWLVTHRSKLPGRDVEDFPLGHDGQAGLLGNKGFRSRSSRPEPAHFGIRPRHLSVQGMRLHGNAALPLALLLLPESRDGSSR